MTLRAATLVWCLALFIRLLNAAAMPHTPEVLLADDAAGYWRGAGVMLETGTFGRATARGVVPETDRVPLYFMFLAGLRWLFGPSFGAVLVAQSLIDATTCLLIGLLWSRLSAAAGTAAALLAAIWPNLVIHSASILTDTLFLLSWTILLWAIVRLLATGSWQWGAAAGALLGAATMVRPIGQFLAIPILGLAVAAPLWHRLGLRRAALSALVFALAALVPVSPILYRNLAHHDRLALTTQGGNHLLWHVVPQVETAASGTPRSATVRRLKPLFAERVRAEGRDERSLDAFERSRIETRLAMEILGRAPMTALAAAWLEGAAVNLLAPAALIDPRVRNLIAHPSFVDTGGDDLPTRALRYFSGSPGPYQIVLVLGGFGALLAGVLQFHGFLLLWRRQRPIACLAAAGILWILMINGPIASPKYRMPAEPILIGLAALSIVELVNRRRAATSAVSPDEPERAPRNR